MTETRRSLGDLDAATDPSFRDHFVESLDLLRINTRSSDIIYGMKGVGKTALRRALTDLHADRYFHTRTVDLDQINFPHVYSALLEINRSSRADVTALARKAWLNVLSVYCLETVADALSENDELKTRIKEFLAGKGFPETESPHNLLIRVISGLLTWVAGIGVDKEEHLKGAGDSQPLTLMNDLSLNSSLRALLLESCALIERSGKGVLICLDGFDSIVEHNADSRKAIFAGLIDAVYRCTKDPAFSKGFGFKAFLPQELTEEARNTVWDSEKYIFNTHSLKWSEKNFQDLIAKRLRPYAKTKSTAFGDIWRDFMPERLTNPSHKTDESTFSYVLRHTLYRPRHLLIQLQFLLDRWDESHSSFRIDPSFIPAVVAQTNQKLAERVVSQLALAHPTLPSFLRSWTRSSNTILLSDFLSRIGRYFNCPGPQEAGEVFDSLFNFGIFGLARASEIKKGQKNSSFQFGFVGDRIAGNLSTMFMPNDVVALSPMLSEYCGCTISEYGAVIPVE
jgi:hypothetical protein